MSNPGKLLKSAPMLAWIGVLLLAAGFACQIEMARLKQIGTDRRYEPKENTPAALQAAIEHSIKYYGRYAAFAPFRNGLVIVGSGLIITGISWPTARVRTKRHVLLATITGGGALYSTSLFVSIAANPYAGAALGLFSWYPAQWIIRTLRWDRPMSRSRLKPNKDRDTEFQRHFSSAGMQAMMIAAWAKFAKLDGRVSRHELDVVERWMKAMRFSSESRLRAIATFQDAKTGPASFWETAVALAGWNTEPYRPFKCIFIFGLFDLAHADGEMSFRDEDLMQDICELHEAPFKKWSDTYQKLRTLSDGIEGFVAELLGFDSDESERAAPAAVDSETAYSILGCQPTDSDETIRDRYRNLARAFHPDALAAKELSSELLQVAEERFKAIQVAYDSIRQARHRSNSEYVGNL